MDGTTCLIQGPRSATAIRVAHHQRFRDKRHVPGCQFFLRRASGKPITAMTTRYRALAVSSTGTTRHPRRHTHAEVSPQSSVPLPSHLATSAGALAGGMFCAVNTPHLNLCNPRYLARYFVSLHRTHSIMRDVDARATRTYALTMLLCSAGFTATIMVDGTPCLSPAYQSRPETLSSSLIPRGSAFRISVLHPRTRSAPSAFALLRHFAGGSLAREHGKYDGGTRRLYGRSAVVLVLTLRIPGGWSTNDAAPAHTPRAPRSSARGVAVTYVSRHVPLTLRARSLAVTLRMKVTLHMMISRFKVHARRERSPHPPTPSFLATLSPSARARPSSCWRHGNTFDLDISRLPRLTHRSPVHPQPLLRCVVNGPRCRSLRMSSAAPDVPYPGLRGQHHGGAARRLLALSRNHFAGGGLVLKHGRDFNRGFEERGVMAAAESCDGDVVDGMQDGGVGPANADALAALRVRHVCLRAHFPVLIAFQILRGALFPMHTEDGVPRGTVPSGPSALRPR
ncbi:hypothetical protein C8J57DRAFT_1726348 [Mycena rebaudengoi]|nr:hypothetical protein C8J57DRAFT_1726348 [Mycena rebaudengoi]